MAEILLGALLISNIGLFVFWSGSRIFYLVVSIVRLLATPMLGSIIKSGRGDWFGPASIMLSEVILGLIYFSPLQNFYKRKNLGEAPAAPLPSPPPATVKPEAVARPEPPSAPPASETRAPGKAALFCGSCGASSRRAKFCRECGESLVLRNVWRRVGLIGM